MANAVLIVLTASLLAPIGVFCLECALALLPRGGRRETGARPPAVVLIPAHNEEAGIGTTLENLLPTLAADDRVIVVADNCSDMTASAARSHGAVVVERTDRERRGKGYALEFGMREVARLVAAMSESPAASPVIVFLDADCRVATDTVDQLARCAARTGGPVQGLNLSEADSRGVQAVSSLGFHFKNLVRPAGLATLGMPCPLMGTGMALPWELARRTTFGGENLAEDMQLGVDLALAGKPAVFCPTALVTSRLPTGKQAFLSQRTRWEHGHLRTSLTQIPRLLAGFLRSGDVRMLGLALDLLVPPLSLLIFAWLGAWGASTMAAFAGASPVPATILAAAGIAMGTVALLGWAKYCRRAIPFGSLLAIPAYMVRKLPIYLSFLARRGPRGWVRTEREAAPAK
jgi:cellulose synthase/poly-beta-1,6-N-acetylglucosamine synthase-like glycosyltransferase